MSNESILSFYFTRTKHFFYIRDESVCISYTSINLFLFILFECHEKFFMTILSTSTKKNKIDAFSHGDEAHIYLVFVSHISDARSMDSIVIRCWFSLFFFAGKWCQRPRDWNSPPDAQRAASDAARRGVLYSSVFLGSPGKYIERKKKTLTWQSVRVCYTSSLAVALIFHAKEAYRHRPLSNTNASFTFFFSQLSL